MNKLKCCPFCGSNVFVGRYEKDNVVIGYMICHEFQTKSCIISQPSTIYASEEMTIEAWNKRV
jgi:hypothetical protein